jgi:Ran GTPase-activating protein (RanGAP) involved in mRNA processing and transport
MNLLNDYFTRDDERIYKSLKELVLDKNMIGEAGARIVGQFLPRLENLEYFSFNGCRPNTQGTKFLCDGLMELTEKTHCVLRRIEMEDCTFGSGEEDTDPIIPFCSAIAKCSRLQRLNINEGSLEIEGIKQLVSALKEARARLTHLSLGTYAHMTVLSMRIAVERSLVTHM